MVTMTIIAICAVVWVGELVSPAVFRAVAFRPDLGADEPWRLLTSAFAHSPNQVFHILFNMYAAWIVGQYIEPMLGRARYLALYLLSALGGSVAFLLMAFPPTVAEYNAGDYGLWFTPVVGASGAVFGLFGALFVLNRRLGRSSTSLLVLLGINAAIPLFVPNVAWQAHIGGFVVGIAAAAVVAHLGRRVSVERPGNPKLHWIGFGVILAVLVALTVAKYVVTLS